MEPDTKTPSTAVSTTLDWQLQRLVALANAGPSFSITLTTAAGIVTGTLIGGVEYIDAFSAEFLKGADDEASDVVKEVFDTWKAPYLEVKEGDEDDDDPSFIHLRDARLLTSGGFVSAGAIWRGRIDQVIGFTLGLLK